MGFGDGFGGFLGFFLVNAEKDQDRVKGGSDLDSSDPEGTNWYHFGTTLT